MESTTQVVPTSQLHFDEFYRINRDELARALVLAVRDPDLGIEAADEAMTRAYQRWRAVRHYSNPMGWLYRVGVNWARTRMRRTRREFSFAEPLMSQPPFDGFDPEIERALGEVSLEHRTVLVLRFYFDWELNRIAESLDVPLGTVKSRLSRALDALERRLEVRR